VILCRIKEPGCDGRGPSSPEMASVRENVDEPVEILGGRPWTNRRAVGVSILMCSGVMAGAAAVAFSAVDAGWFQGTGAASDPVWKHVLGDRTQGVGSVLEAAGAVAVINLGVAATLFSGILTFGLTSVLGAIATGIYVGATMKVAVAGSGWFGVLVETGSYAPLEFIGVMVAGAAGMMPAASVMVNLPGHAGMSLRTILRRYALSCGLSLRWFGLAVALISVAAVIEGVRVSVIASG